MKDQEIIESIEKLRIESGDLLVINLQVPSTPENVSHVKEIIDNAKLLPDGARAVVCDKLTRLEVIKNGIS